MTDLSCVERLHPQIPTEHLLCGGLKALSTQEVQRVSGLPSSREHGRMGSPSPPPSTAMSKGDFSTNYLGVYEHGSNDCSTLQNMMIHLIKLGTHHPIAVRGKMASGVCMWVCGRIESERMELIKEFERMVKGGNIQIPREVD